MLSARNVKLNKSWTLFVVVAVFKYRQNQVQLLDLKADLHLVGGGKVYTFKK